MARYQVKPGQTLWEIAKANPIPGKTVTETIKIIADASGIKNANKIKAGQVITIPGGEETTVDIPLPRMRPEPAPAPIPPKLEGAPPGVGANQAAMEASRQDGSFGGAFTSGAKGVGDPGYPAGAGGARPDPTRRPWLAPSPPPPVRLQGGATTSAGASAMATGEIGPPPLQTEVMGRPETPAPTGLPMSDVLMEEGPGMNNDGLIRPVSPEEQALQGGAMPLPLSPQAMDPMIAEQLSAGPPMEENVIGPQFNSSSFGPSPQGGMDPAIQAIMNDPARRQMMIDALMRGGM